MIHGILRSTPATLELPVYLGGVLTDLDALPTLLVLDGNGDTVTTSAVTKPGVPDNVGIYQAVLPAQDDLKILVAKWTGLLDGEAVTLYQDYEIVGNLLFTEADARNAKIVGGQTALADETEYPDELIAGWRQTIGELFESRMTRPVVRRYCRVRFSGGGGRMLDMSYGRVSLENGSSPHRPGRAHDINRIISATVNGVAQTVGDLQIDGYKLWHTTGSWSSATYSNPRNIVVEYEYGPDPVWAEAHQRALDLLLANAAPKGFPSSATSINTEDGTFRITNFPVAVEEFLKAHKQRKGFGIA